MAKFSIIVDGEGNAVDVSEDVAGKWVAAGIVVEEPRKLSTDPRVGSLTEPFRSIATAVTLVTALGDD